MLESTIYPHLKPSRFRRQVNILKVKSPGAVYWYTVYVGSRSGIRLGPCIWPRARGPSQLTTAVYYLFLNPSKVARFIPSILLSS